MFSHRVRTAVSNRILCVFGVDVMNSFSNAVLHQLMREPSNENLNISARITKQTQWDRSEVDQLEKKKIDAILLGFEMLWSMVK